MASEPCISASIWYFEDKKNPQEADDFPLFETTRPQAGFCVPKEGFLATACGKWFSRKRGKMEKAKKKRASLSALTILMAILVVLAIITVIMAAAGVEGITGATLSGLLTAPVRGWSDALSVNCFIMILGGFLGVVTATGALNVGIDTLVRKLHGKEIWIIPILMILFSVGGTVYGMGEETVPFYILLASTMVAAGFDSMVGVGTVLLGAGCGVLGSTVNPFAVGVAVDALKTSGVEANQAIIIVLGAILWIVATAMAIMFMVRYAKKVKADKGSTILSLQEQEEMRANFGEVTTETSDICLSGRQKGVLIVFAITFVVMIIGFIPWESFGITAFVGWSCVLTGFPLGEWYFDETSTWFLIASIVIAIVGGLSESKFIKSFVAGAADMIAVLLVIALARSITVLMNDTGLSMWILENAANILSGMSGALFAPLSYLLYLGISFLIPSSSGLATVSMPIMGPLASGLGFSPEVMVMIFSAGNGLINLFTPTCGFIMGGLAAAKVEWSTWLKFSWKIILAIGIASCVILTAAMIIL